jgi:hypothetical protein
MKANLKKDLYTSTIAGADFTAFDVEIKLDTLVINQTYYILVRKGTAFFFVLTRYDENYAKPLSNILNTLRFEG